MEDAIKIVRELVLMNQVKITEQRKNLINEKDILGRMFIKGAIAAYEGRAMTYSNVLSSLESNNNVTQQ